MCAFGVYVRDLTSFELSNGALSVLCEIAINSALDLFWLILFGYHWQGIRRREIQDSKYR